MASEDKATEGQIKRLYAVLHSVGLDPTQWKKDQNIASYAKLTRAQCSAYIDEVEALEAEQKTEGSMHGKFEGRADAEAQRIRKEQGRAATPAATPAAAKPTVPELISKYLDILVQVTIAINAEDRIPDREKGFATKFLYYSVKGAIENGGDHEEQV